MRKLIFVLLSAVLILAFFAGCAEVTPESSKEELEEAFLGATQEEIRRAFGQPDGILSGLWGDIYLRGENEMVIFYYEDYDGIGCVEGIKITERQV